MMVKNANASAPATAELARADLAARWHRSLPCTVRLKHRVDVARRDLLEEPRGQ